jgi:hypothetical protein
VDPATKALLSMINDFDMTGAELLSMQDYEEIHLDFIPASFLSQHLLIDPRRSSSSSQTRLSISPDTVSASSDAPHELESDAPDWVELGVYAYNDQIEKLMEGIKEFCFSFRYARRGFLKRTHFLVWKLTFHIWILLQLYHF